MEVVYGFGIMILFCAIMNHLEVGIYFPFRNLRHLIKTLRRIYKNEKQKFKDDRFDWPPGPPTKQA